MFILNVFYIIQGTTAITIIITMFNCNTKRCDLCDSVLGGDDLSVQKGRKITGTEVKRITHITDENTINLSMRIL